MPRSFNFKVPRAFILAYTTRGGGSGFHKIKIVTRHKSIATKQPNLRRSNSDETARTLLASASVEAFRTSRGRPSLLRKAPAGQTGVQKASPRARAYLSVTWRAAHERPTPRMSSHRPVRKKTSRFSTWNNNTRHGNSSAPASSIADRDGGTSSAAAAATSGNSNSGPAETTNPQRQLSGIEAGASAISTSSVASLRTVAGVLAAGPTDWSVPGACVCAGTGICLVPIVYNGDSKCVNCAKNATRKRAKAARAASAAAGGPVVHLPPKWKKPHGEFCSKSAGGRAGWETHNDRNAAAAKARETKKALDQNRISKKEQSAVVGRSVQESAIAILLSSTARSREDADEVRVNHRVATTQPLSFVTFTDWRSLHLLYRPR